MAVHKRWEAPRSAHFSCTPMLFQVVDAVIAVGQFELMVGHSGKHWSGASLKSGSVEEAAAIEAHQAQQVIRRCETLLALGSPIC
jgi:hypothetical protein